MLVNSSADMAHESRFFSLRVALYSKRSVWLARELTKVENGGKHVVVSFTFDCRQMKTMAQSLDSMAAYMQMTDDSVYNQILYSVNEDQNVQMARTILKQIETRNIYKLVGQTQLKTQINRASC